MESIYVAQLVEVVENQHFTTDNLLLEIASRDLSKIASQMSIEVSNTRSFNLNRQTRDSFNEKYLIHEEIDLYDENEIKQKCFEVLTQALVDKDFQKHQIIRFSSKLDHHTSTEDDVVLHLIVKKLNVI